jgi:hypothetical protein
MQHLTGRGEISKMPPFFEVRGWANAAENEITVI